MMTDKGRDLYIDKYCELLRTYNGITDVGISLISSEYIKVNFTYVTKLHTVEFYMNPFNKLIFIIGEYKLDITNKDINLITPILVRFTIPYCSYLIYVKSLQDNYLEQLGEISINYMDNLKYKIRNYKLEKLLK